MSFVVQETGSADIADTSDDTAIREAFATWNAVDSMNLAFVEDLAADRSRTDWAADSIHLVLFDETNATSFFPTGSGIIAITAIQFSAAQILDTDIIFNGREFSFSTTGQSERYDIQSIATHEIGHMLGLDHSGCVGATLFPYAAPGITQARALSQDDIAGATLLYPGTNDFATATGTVVRASGGTAISGAQVVALDADGLVVAAGLSAADGSFSIFGLPPGTTYRFYATPFEGVVGEENLSSALPARIDVDFAGTYLGGNGTPTSVAIAAQDTYPVGTISAGPRAAISLTAAGAYPYRAYQGTLQTFYVAGDGLVSGTTFSITGTGLSPIATFFYSVGDSTAAQVLYTIAADADPGPRTIVASRGGELAFLTAGIEVIEPLPTISSVLPEQGSVIGSEAVWLRGTHLQQGSRVFFGPTLGTVYAWLDAENLMLMTPASDPGTVAVSLHFPDGQMARLASGFTFIAQPAVDSIFPATGSSAGGTAVSIFGADFVDGLTVTVGGNAATVQAVADTRIDILTPAGNPSAGPVGVTVTNPGGLGDTLVNAFTYIDGEDPQIDDLFPTSGSTAGGTRIVIQGSGFRSGAAVWIGVAADGSGGLPATDVAVTGETEITAYTPASSAGEARVLVINDDETSSFAPTTYLYVAPGGGGGGGGGCGGLPAYPPGDRGRGAALYALAAALWLAVRLRRAARIRMNPR
ncbi:MAG: IPT/TIG domain-containing protein [Planctomycetes bacterium]|nr:IPT/TIG domain-containing protein [Planctomycetota bacterium]